MMQIYCMAGPSHLFQQNYKHLAYRKFAWQCNLRSAWKVENPDKETIFRAKVTYKTSLSSIHEIYIKPPYILLIIAREVYQEFRQTRNKNYWEEYVTKPGTTLRRLNFST